MMLMSTLPLSVWLSVLVGLTAAFTTNTSTSGKVRYEIGDQGSIVVITAPHGGSKTAGYTRRTGNGCYVNGKCTYETLGCTDTDSTKKCKPKTLKDTASAEIAEKLADKIKTHSPNSVRPHVIYCDLHRSRLDANRDVAEATFGMAKAKIVYDEYHGYIEDAIKAASAGYTRNVFYIDVHGQAGNAKSVIGHLLDNNTPTGLRQTVIPDSQAPATSLAHLFTTAGQTLEELVRGSSSIGGLMENHDPNIEVIPSPNNPRSLSGKWYRGGFSLRTYAVNPASGIQIEVNSAIRKASDPQVRTDFADTMAKAVVDWLDTYY